MPARKPITAGTRFSRLKVIELVYGTKPTIAICQCDCGSFARIARDKLVNGHTKSCGCLNLEKLRQRGTTHGHTTGIGQSRTYNTWVAMISRTGLDYFKYYKPRGIGVCDRWKKFENFLADMGERPEGKTLDRYPNQNGNYEPGNCRWASAKEQSRNTSRNRYLEFNGERRSLAEWAELLGRQYSTVKARLNRGWSIDRALMTPSPKEIMNGP